MRNYGSVFVKIWPKISPFKQMFVWSNLICMNTLYMTWKVTPTVSTYRKEIKNTSIISFKPRINNEPFFIVGNLIIVYFIFRWSFRIMKWTEAKHSHHVPVTSMMTVALRLCAVYEDREPIHGYRRRWYSSSLVIICRRLDATSAHFQQTIS